MRVCALTILLAWMVSNPKIGTAQAPAGYHLGPAVFLPDSARDVLAGGRFRITVQRQIRDTQSRRLLELAERLFPDTSLISRDAAKETQPPAIQRLQQAAQLPGERWWWDNFDAVLTPYAVTGAAVKYYRERIYDRASSDNPFTFSQPVPLHQGEFAYRATVERIDARANNGATYVARLRLSWNYWCGMLCAVTFDATRNVFFGADGTPIRVEGDGKPMLAVS